MSALLVPGSLARCLELNALIIRSKPYSDESVRDVCEASAFITVVFWFDSELV